MAGRPRQFDEEDVIHKAMNVFWRKGYEASSSDELLQAMGMGKGSFYLHFRDGKKELFRRTMEQRSTKAMQRLQKRLQESPDKVGVIRSIFFERLEADDLSREQGCYFGNAIVEMSHLDDEMKKLAAFYLGKLEKIFEEVVDEAQKEEKIVSKKSPKFIARHLINTWNGMNITKRMNNNMKDLRNVIEMNLEILD